MSRLLYITTILVGCVSPSLALGAGNRVEYSPEGAAFKVSFKAKPDEEQRSHKGWTTLKMASVAEENGVYMFSYADVPFIGADETREQTQERLDGARDGALRNIKAKLTNEEDVTLAKKHPGREISAELPGKGLLKARIFIVNDRIYQIMVIGTKEFVEADETDRFLTSLKLIK